MLTNKKAAQSTVLRGERNSRRTRFCSVPDAPASSGVCCFLPLFVASSLSAGAGDRLLSR